MKRLSPNEYAVWMRTVDLLGDRARSKRGLKTDEADFYASWWLSIDSGCKEASRLVWRLISEGVLS